MKWSVGGLKELDLSKGNKTSLPKAKGFGK